MLTLFSQNSSSRSIPTILRRISGKCYIKGTDAQTIQRKIKDVTLIIPPCFESSLFLFYVFLKPALLTTENTEDGINPKNDKTRIGFGISVIRTLNLFRI